MSDPRDPVAGELQLVVLRGTDRFIAWSPLGAVERLCDAFEARLGLTAEARTSQVRQMELRLETTRRLATPDCERLFQEVLGSACLWLAFRHYQRGDAMRRGLDGMGRDAAAVLTVSIGSNPGTVEGTAWAFMLGDRVHDGRAQLAAHPAGTVEFFERDPD